jgi:hypothetical protein
MGPFVLPCLQRAKSKLVLEHLVVAKAGRTDKLEQATLDDILRFGAEELFAEEAAAATQDPQQQQQQQQQIGSQDGTAGFGQKQLRIVWDDDALDRLLDRSQMRVEEAPAEAEEDEDDFSKAFKVIEEMCGGGGGNKWKGVLLGTLHASCTAWTWCRADRWLTGRWGVWVESSGAVVSIGRLAARWGGGSTCGGRR